ncbi:hypothetical protein BDV12DRAFT_203765 [Aspergillus spectabilis]
MELIAKQRYNRMECIRFYNLRNYDRIKYTVPRAAPQASEGFGPDTRPAFDISAIYQSYPSHPKPEELYVHSKVMLADDRIVIYGSANINDRSQVGDHDSEIAILIEDRTPVSSKVNGQVWTSSRCSLVTTPSIPEAPRPLPPQDYEHINDQFDFDPPESQILADPLEYWGSYKHRSLQ